MTGREPTPEELDSLARTRHMPAITKTNGQRLLTAREYHINMTIACSLCFGLGVLVGVIGLAVFA